MEPEWIRVGTFLLSHKDSAKVEAAKVTGCRISISGMLKFLGVSRSGYRSFLNRKVSPSCRRKAAIKKEIQKIYANSKQNYGAPKIAQELRRSGETISQRTVGKYMREIHICHCHFFCSCHT